MAVTARAKDSRCTSASRLGNLGHIRSISVLLKPEFAALAVFDVGSQSARICRKHWPSQSNTPRPTVLADILYELQTILRSEVPISVRAEAQRVQTASSSACRSVESPPTSFRPGRRVEKNRLAKILSVGGFHPFRPALRRLNLRFLP